ncbi:MAG: beta-ketoacyl-ACP synthase II [Verrucomicrobiota bacterium]
MLPPDFPLMNSERRVVITGVGVVSPIGNDTETFLQNSVAGKSGIRAIQAFDPSELPVRIAGEVLDFNPKAYFKSPKDVRRADRFTQLGLAASKMAYEQAGFDIETPPENADRIATMVSSGIGGLQIMTIQHEILMNKGAPRVSPFVIPMMIANITSGIVSMEYGLRGPNMSIVTACATANHNIGEAWRIIKFGDADAALAGGSEAAIVRLGVVGFANMKALSTRNDDPAAASRPFDTGRDGFVMGEGAGVVMIEELEHAKKRGAEILAEITGYGISADAYHITSPHPEGEGASRCMEMALGHAQLNPEDVDYVNAHGTSTPLGDICETKAIKQTFGEHAKSGLKVSSTKSMTGHLLGAAGGVELAACVGAIRDGVIPPTINLEDQDPECDLDYVANEARETPVKAALSNSFGFGGHNASILVEKFEG